MGIIEINGGPITYRYLMNKSKSDLAHLVLEYLGTLQKQGLPFPFQTEFNRAVEKYPATVWADLGYDEMMDLLLREADELKLALQDGELNGPHGIIREGAHVQVVAQRIVNEMRRRNR